MSTAAHTRRGETDRLSATVELFGPTALTSANGTHGGFRELREAAASTRWTKDSKVEASIIVCEREGERRQNTTDRS
jgi:hypothetical protein